MLFRANDSQCVHQWHKGSSIWWGDCGSGIPAERVQAVSREDLLREKALFPCSRCFSADTLAVYRSILRSSDRHRPIHITQEYVLGCAFRQDQPIYGYRVMQIHPGISVGSIYNAIEQLTKLGLMQEVDPVIVKNKLRRMFEITAKGKEFYTDQLT